MSDVVQHLFPASVSATPPRLDELSSSVWEQVAATTRGIFSDVDDTLTHAGALVPDAYAAMCRARAAGLRLVLVTGRPIGWAEVLASIFPVDAAIAENGAVAVMPGPGGHRRFYFEDEAARAEGARLRQEARLLVERELPAARLTADHALREVDLAFDIAERVRLDEPAIARVTAVLERVGLRTIRSSIHLHGTFSAGDKGKMSARVAEQLWGETPDAVREHYLYVGDSPNDAPAFSFFTRSIGVANVLECQERLVALGALPWAVTRGAGGHGFAELIDAVLAAR
jgi:HAD superfamily hydrolase (TIGR01484 family)